MAQSCSLAAVNTVNTNLAAPGAGGRDVLRLNFRPVTIACVPRNGNGGAAPPNRIDISHCPGRPQDICFVTRLDTRLTAVNITGPGLPGAGVNPANDVEIDLQAGTFTVNATARGVAANFSFTIIELAVDNQRLLAQEIPINLGPPPALSIANTTDGQEPGTDGLFTVTQASAGVTDTVLSYTVSGTATAGTDYTALSGSVTIAAGDTTATISVPVIDDLEVEGDETVIVTLTAVTSGFAIFSGTISSTNTIIDDDGEINDRVAQAFQSQVYNFVSRRLTLQSRFSPSIHRTSKDCSDNENPLNGSVSLSGDGNGASGSLSIANGRAGCNFSNQPYFWAEAEFSYFADNDLSDPRNTIKRLIGLKIDWTITQGQASGTGWAIGPYVSTKVSENLQFDLRGLWGTSSNDANQVVLGSNFAGSFDTDRWIVEGIVSGSHDIDEFSIKPSARLFYMSEDWDDYTVTDGNRLVTVPGDNAEIGNLSAALELSKTTKNADFSVETFVSGEVFWTFKDPGIIDSTGLIIEDDEYSASLSAGIGIEKENSSFRVEATYGGIGERGLESVSGSISLSHSVGSGNGGDLGGLEGADAHCGKLAEAAGSTGKNWKAYLSTQEEGKRGISARDRIGTGPWHNSKGVLIAKDLDELHLNPNIVKSTALDESG
ncbi:hypothetical protein GQR58_004314 [Nymphon striatum]|nr:hypothetical protein GQR58_004314 [Nymphon striatum]